MLPYGNPRAEGTGAALASCARRLEPLPVLSSRQGSPPKHLQAMAVTLKVGGTRFEIDREQKACLSQSQNTGRAMKPALLALTYCFAGGG